MAAHGRVIARAFGIGYHDGRTGLTKTDNRPLAVRQVDHKNIRLGTYGGSLIATQPAGPGILDFIFWGALHQQDYPVRLRRTRVALGASPRRRAVEMKPTKDLLQGEHHFVDSGGWLSDDATLNYSRRMITFERFYLFLIVFTDFSN
jgi:hypothetical protein